MSVTTYKWALRFLITHVRLSIYSFTTTSKTARGYRMSRKQKFEERMCNIGGNNIYNSYDIDPVWHSYVGERMN